MAKAIGQDFVTGIAELENVVAAAVECPFGDLSFVK
jgi:hypothetical protein